MELQAEENIGESVVENKIDTVIDTINSIEISDKVKDKVRVPSPTPKKLIIHSLDLEDEDTNLYDISDIVVNDIPDSWEELFLETRNELLYISSRLKEISEKKTIYPYPVDIFNALRHTKLNEVNVVIVGQDPYHTKSKISGLPIAHGLSFSVRETEKIPPSLVNIFTEIRNSYPDFVIPKHGNLTKWADQGVLMLNSCLTVEEGTPAAHCGKTKKLWDPFISKLFKYIEAANPKCIYVLWGKDAQSIKKYLDEKSTFLEEVHPSPLSAYRGFLGCGHFLKINKKLKKLGKPQINW